MNQYWHDKVALVTGGSSGIGLQIVRALARSCAKVALVGLEEDVVKQVADELGPSVLGIAADLTDEKQVDLALEEVLHRFGRLDMLVNAAGRTDRGRVLDTTPEQFRKCFELNFLTMVSCSRAAIPHLLKRHGHIVNIGSLAAKSASRFVGAYPVTKHAVAAYTQQLRLELGPEGLHTLLVCPGPVGREGERLYELPGTENLPESARHPGAGVDTKLIDPEWLAAAILKACIRRKPELIVPGKARLLFAISQLFPKLGDRIILKKTGGNKKG
jgi:uncharacterized protein